MWNIGNRLQSVLNWREPSILLILVVVITAGIGGFLLWLPWANGSGTFSDPIPAWFTAVSAVSLTGLVVVDTSEWTLFGQIVVMTLVFLGGLGLITGLALVLLILRQRPDIRSSMLIKQDAGTGSRVPSIPKTIRNIMIVAIGVQLASTTIFFLEFYFLAPLWDGIRIDQALWRALFHAVSAFNNAGLDILPDSQVGGSSLSGVSTKYLTISTTLLASLIGAISYPVLQDLWLTRGRLGKLQLDSKLILMGTLLVSAIAGTLILLLEFGNSATLGDLPVGAKLLSALFESTSTRISGFTTAVQTELSSTSQILNTFLIFIGGAAGSTAGGLKVGTMAVLVLLGVSLLRGRRDVRVFRRNVAGEIVRRAMLLATWMLSVWLILSLALTIIQPQLDTFGAVFEVASALNSAGLSLGITAELNAGGQVVILIAMLLGRYGIAYWLLRQFSQRTKQNFSYPEEDIRMG